MKIRNSVFTDSNGYTLIEVILFLAISGSLAAIALIGLGSRLSNVRFTDATKSVQAEISQQIINSQIGVSRNDDEILCRYQQYIGNPYGQPEIVEDGAISSGSSQDCVINGKLAYILDSEVEYLSLVSLRKPTIQPGCEEPADTFEAVVKCYRPRVPRSGISVEAPLVQKKQHKNGLKAEATPGGEFPIGFGYIQNPNSASKYFFWFKPEVGDTDGIYNTQFINSPNMGNSVQTENSWLIDSEKSVCLKLNNRKAQLVFLSGAQQPTLRSEGCS